MDTVNSPDHVEEQVDTSKWNAPETSLLDDLVQLVNAAGVWVAAEAEGDVGLRARHREGAGRNDT